MQMIRFDSELLQEQVRMLLFLHDNLDGRLTDLINVEKDLSSIKQNKTILACKNAICERNQYSPKYKNTAFPTLKHYPRGEGSERSETDRATREKSVSNRRCGRPSTQEYIFPQIGYKKTQPMRAALSDFKNYTLKRK